MCWIREKALCPGKAIKANRIRTMSNPKETCQFLWGPAEKFQSGFWFWSNSRLVHVCRGMVSVWQVGQPWTRYEFKDFQDLSSSKYCTSHLVSVWVEEMKPQQKVMFSFKQNNIKFTSFHFIFIMICFLCAMLSPHITLFSSYFKVQF